MKIKNRNKHRQNYLENHSLKLVSSGKILKQVDILLPDKYYIDYSFKIGDIEKDYNIKVLKFYVKYDIKLCKEISRHAVILNKQQYEKEFGELKTKKIFSVDINKKISTTGHSCYSDYFSKLRRF